MIKHLLIESPKETSILSFHQEKEKSTNHIIKQNLKGLEPPRGMIQLMQLQ